MNSLKARDLDCSGSSSGRTGILLLICTRLPKGRKDTLRNCVGRGVESGAKTGSVSPRHFPENE